MGYGSEVLIKIPAYKYKEFLELVRNNNSEYCLLDDKNMVQINRHSGENIEETWIYFNWIKWYEDYKEIKAITKALDTFSERGISWSFGRCGEDREDNNTQHEEGNDPEDEVDYCEIERTLS